MTPHRYDGSRRGFTLVEIMVVVAIVGVLTTIALPSLQRLTLRSKTAERAELMLRIKNAVHDYYVQNGRIVTAAGAGLVGDWQPALPASSLRRVPNWTADDWGAILPNGAGVEGATYYSYRFETIPAAGSAPAQLTIAALADLDADGIPSTKTMTFDLVMGSLHLVSEDPPAGEEDPGVF